MRGMALLADLVRDFRYAGRSLARSPGFTVVAVAVLALGIGATSAIFSLVSAVWLRPLPFADAERIVTLWHDLSATGGPTNVNLAPAVFVAGTDIRTHSRVVAARNVRLRAPGIGADQLDRTTGAKPLM